MPFAFGPDRRLRRHSEFVREQRSARRVAAGAFTLLVAAQPDPAAAARLGLVVARKVGGAVQRNRVKRLCRECFRLCPDMLPPGVDLIVVAHPGADRLELAAVQAQWSAVVGLLRKRAAEALARRARADHPPATGSTRA